MSEITANAPRSTIVERRSWILVWCARGRVVGTPRSPAGRGVTEVRAVARASSARSWRRFPAAAWSRYQGRRGVSVVEVAAAGSWCRGNVGVRQRCQGPPRWPRPAALPQVTAPAVLPHARSWNRDHAPAGTGCQGRRSVRGMSRSVRWHEVTRPILARFPRAGVASVPSGRRAAGEGELSTLVPLPLHVWSGYQGQYSDQYFALRKVRPIGECDLSVTQCGRVDAPSRSIGYGRRRGVGVAPDRGLAVAVCPSLPCGAEPAGIAGRDRRCGNRPWCGAPGRPSGLVGAVQRSPARYRPTKC